MDMPVTVCGNLTADPVHRTTASGAMVVNLRIASSNRRLDRSTGEWRDGEPLFISASCWRTLAGNVLATLRKGDGVVVHGRLSMRTYDDREGNRRTIHEIEAAAVGPDLTRCPAELRRPQRLANAVPVQGEAPAAIGTSDDRDADRADAGAHAERPAPAVDGSADRPADAEAPTTGAPTEVAA
jgi:single-strand DNA-binding protein